MQKFILLVSVFVLSITQLHAAKNPLLGSWKVIKAKSAYVDATLSETECKQANGVIVTFLPDKIVVQKNNFFSGTDPNEKPHYRLKTVNALKYFHTKKLMKRFECSTSNVQIMYTGVGVPFTEIIFANNNTISIAIDEDIYFLVRIK